MTSQCQYCGAKVSEQYARVFGDRDDVVHRCLACDCKNRLQQGSAAGKDVKAPDPADHPNRNRGYQVDDDHIDYGKGPATDDIGNYGCCLASYGTRIKAECSCLRSAGSALMLKILIERVTDCGLIRVLMKRHLIETSSSDYYANDCAIGKMLTKIWSSSETLIRDILSVRQLTQRVITSVSTLGRSDHR